MSSDWRGLRWHSPSIPGAPRYARGSPSWRDPRGALQRTGVDTLYGFLLGSTLLPVAAAAAQDPGNAIIALSGIVGGVGANLVSNLVQKRYDGPDAATVIAAEATEPALAPAYAELVARLDVLVLVKAELVGHTELLQRLNDELRRLGPAGPFAGATIRIEQSGGFNAGAGNTFGQTGDLIAGDKIVNNFFGGKPGEDGQRLLRDYLSTLLDECRQLRLARLTGRAQSGAEQSAVPQVRLDQVYTDLTVDAQVKVGRAHRYSAARGRAVLQRYLRRAVSPDVAPATHCRSVTVTTVAPQDRHHFITRWDEFRSLPDDTPIEVNVTRPLLALEAAHIRRLVLLGEPGSGKSTVLRELALLLALRLTGQPVAIPDWPMDAAPVPVYVPLGQVAALLERHNHDAGTALQEAIGDALEGEHRIRAGLRDFLTPALRKGGVLLLFDGLDELPAAARTPVSQAIRRLAGDVAAPLMITSRVLPYRESMDWQLPEDEGWQVQTVQPLASGQVRVFVRQWYAALADPRGDLTPERAATRAAELLTQLEQRTELAPLIQSPLLLTMLAILHYNTDEVPRDRVRLYEECVQLLLERWEPERTPGVSHRRLTERLGNIPGLTIDRIRDVLHELAFESHDAPPGDDGRGMIDGDRLSGKLLKLFRRLGATDPAMAEQAFLRVLRADAGLLQERGEGVFAFPHLTFQEYLAACYLADLPQMGEQAASRWCGVDAGRWREVLMLLVGRLRRQGKTDDKLIPWLAQLAAARVGRVTKIPARRRREALLAALCYAEMGGAAALATSTVDIEAQLEQPLRAAIVDLLAEHDPAITVTDRIAAARVLSDLGDPRVPVTRDEWTAALAQRNETLGAPDGYWCYVPGRTYRIGGWDKGEASADITLCPYWIARYPVTVAQYRAFIDAGGYANDACWTPEGWTWKRDRSRTEPWGWDDPQFSGANQPVIGVTWYEAAAFCAWLNARLTGVLPDGYVLRLPTEAEWEAAAAYDAAGRRRAYPWGPDEPVPERAIYDASKLNAAAPVGCCPAGAAACGALDMVGNVWEVTTSSYGHYPAGSARREEDFTPDTWDVPWRGGSYRSNSTSVCCRARVRNNPGNIRFDFGGLRLVVAPHRAYSIAGR